MNFRPTSRLQSYAPLPKKRIPPDLKRTTRKNEQFRTMKYEFDIIPDATGSLFAEFGNTKLVVALYGVQQSRDPSKKNQGYIECEFHYSAFAFSQRLHSNQRNQQSIREKEISNAVVECFENVILFEKYPKSVIKIVCYLIENDGSVLSCVINSVSLLLLNCAIEMKDTISCCECIVCNDTNDNKNNNENKEIANGNTNENGNENDNYVCLVDPTLNEEKHVKNKKCEMIVAMMNYRQEVIYCHMKGALSLNANKKILFFLHDGCQQLKEYFKQILFQYFEKKLSTQIDNRNNNNQTKPMTI